jgi:hypothetical protein
VQLIISLPDDDDEKEKITKNEETAEMIADAANFNLLPDDMVSMYSTSMLVLLPTMIDCNNFLFIVCDSF